MGFDIQTFVRYAQNGKPADIKGFAEYTNAFPQVILWGAGNLGKAVATKMLSNGCKISCFWDTQFATIGSVHDIPVLQPFENQATAPSETLIIFCIGNVITRSNLKKTLLQNNFTHILDGTILYQALCPLTIDMSFDANICAKDENCAICGCQKLNNIVIHNICSEKKIKDNILFISTLQFLINTLCNLQCKYCFEYLPSYPQKKRFNIPVGKILNDIDRVFDVADAVGTVLAVGGETFLHPQLNTIVKRILEKKNFGVFIIPTNGLGKMDPTQLEGLDDKRVRVAFSNYLGQLPASKEEIFFKNLELVRSMGINATLQNSLPSWKIPGDFSVKYADDTARNIRNSCSYISPWVYSGKFFICNYSITINNLIANYTDDFVPLDAGYTKQELRDRIFALRNKPHLSSCLHCSWNNSGMADKAGEQGFDERYSLDRFSDIIER